MILGSMGDLLGFKGVIVNFVVRTREEDGAGVLAAAARSPSTPRSPPAAARRCSKPSADPR